MNKLKLKRSGLEAFTGMVKDCLNEDFLQLEQCLLISKLLTRLLNQLLKQKKLYAISLNTDEILVLNKCMKQQHSYIFAPLERVIADDILRIADKTIKNLN